MRHKNSIPIAVNCFTFVNDPYFSDFLSGKDNVISTHIVEKECSEHEAVSAGHGHRQRFLRSWSIRILNILLVACRGTGSVER